MQIPESQSWKICRPIVSGWSHDQKFYIQTEVDAEYLLRISALDSFEEEKGAYRALQEISDNSDALFAKLIKSGLCNGGKNTYRLFSWINGTELPLVLSTFSDQEQYQLGREAGKLLKTLHQASIDPTIPAWESYYQDKIDHKLEQYAACPFGCEDEAVVLDLIQQMRRVVKSRPQSFQHGDFHIGNMLLTPDGKLAVIDFNRLGFGDPWEEFNRLVWSVQQSTWFATGQIDGYFDDQIPPDFFTCMTLYMAVNQIGAIPWAVPFGTDQVNLMIIQLSEFVQWFNSFQRVVPNWYHAPAW